MKVFFLCKPWSPISKASRAAPLWKKIANAKLWEQLVIAVIDFNKEMADKIKIKNDKPQFEKLLQICMLIGPLICALL